MTHPSSPSSPSSERAVEAARWAGLLSLSEFVSQTTPLSSNALVQRLRDMRWTGGAHEAIEELVALDDAETAVPAQAAQRAVGGAMVLGAVVGGALAAARSYPALRQGELRGAEYAEQVVTAAAVVGAGSAGRSAATLALKAGASALARRLGAGAVGRLAGSNAGTLTALALVEQSVDTVKLVRGSISGAEYGARSLRNAGAMGGAYGGAMAGAVVGSAVPGVGTAVGTVVGGMLGAAGASAVLRRVTDALRREGAPLAKPSAA